MTSPIRFRGAVRAAALGAALAAGVTFGAVACTSTPAERSAEQISAAASGATAPETAAPETAVADPTDAPVTDGAVVTDGAMVTDGAAVTSGAVVTNGAGDTVAAYDGGPQGPANGVGDTALPTSTPTPAAPVSTAGPIAPVGSIDDIVQEAPFTTAAPVALADAADFGGQVSAELVEITPIQATATLPGEISGPAVAVTVQIDNNSTDAIGLGSVTVTLADSGGNPASTITGDSAGPLAGALGAGDTAKGMYVFSVPNELRSPVTITVNYSSGAPTLVFTGAVAGG